MTSYTPFVLYLGAAVVGPSYGGRAHPARYLFQPTFELASYEQSKDKDPRPKQGIRSYLAVGCSDFGGQPASQVFVMCPIPYFDFDLLAWFERESISRTCPCALQAHLSSRFCF